MQFLSKPTHIRFMPHRKAALAISALLIAVSIVSFATRSLNWSIDFTGGLLVQAIYPENADLEAARNNLAAAGFDDATVQYFGTSRDVLIRLPASEDIATGLDEADDGFKTTLGDKVLDTLRATTPGVELGRVEFVGPQVGEELREKGITALLIALALIFMYIAFRFQWKFSTGAIVALVHDVLLVVGVFSILQMDFGLPVVAAVLAVIGYSLNDTIVVFDRIRENFHEVRKADAAEIIDLSLNQMLARTIVTGLTTLLVLLALYLFGGEAVRPFSVALIVGIIVGTYSSIYMASATALALNISLDDLVPSEEEHAEIDALP